MFENSSQLVNIKENMSIIINVPKTSSNLSILSKNLYTPHMSRTTSAFFENLFEEEF